MRDRVPDMKPSVSEEDEKGDMMMPYGIYDLVHGAWYFEDRFDTWEDAEQVVYEHAANAHGTELPGQVEIRVIRKEACT